MTLNSAEIVIIGGGVIGCSIAYQLAKRGHEVLLLERGEVAGEASGANASMVGFAAGLPFHASGFWSSAIQQSLRWYESGAGELGEKIAYIRTGGLVLAETTEDYSLLSRLVERKQAEGVNVEAWTAEDLRALEPSISHKVVGAAYAPDQGQANTLVVTLGFAHAAMRLGARIKQGITVLGIDVVDGKVAGVRTDNGYVHAGLVVNAAGAWAGQVSEMVGLCTPVFPKRGEIMVTEPVPHLFDRFISLADMVLPRVNADTLDYEDTASNSVSLGGRQYRVFYARQAATGHVHLGGRGNLAGYSKRPGLSDIAELAANMRQIIPALSNSRVIRTWAGLMALTPDGLPIIGKDPAVDGFVVAAGMGGEGLVIAPSVGVLIAEIVDGKEPFIPIDTIHPSRFSHDAARG